MQHLAEIDKKSSESLAKPWDRPLATWKLFAFLIHIIIQK